MPFPTVRRTALAALGAAAFAALCAAPSAPSGAPRAAPVPAPAPRVPLLFEANRGQAPAGVDFLARSSGGALLVSGAAAEFRAPGGAVRMEVVGARQGVRPRGDGPLRARVNYLRGRDPAAHVREVPTWSSVVCADVREGVDLRFHSERGALEYDLVLAPGADPRDVALRFEGAHGLRVDRGDLVIDLGSEELRHLRPFAYQERERGGTDQVACEFGLSAEGVVGFRVGPHDPARALVIDPLVSWSGYVGGTATDGVQAIALDANGDVLVAGTTQSSDLATTAGAPWATSPGGRSDAFVARLAAGSGQVLFLTYLGGSAAETAVGVAADPAGNVVVAGSTTSTDFPLSANAFRRNFAGGLPEGDFYLARLSPSGTTLVYSTYLGGPGDEACRALAVDGAGDAYLAGSSSSGLLFTPGAAQTVNAGGYDGWLIKFSNAANTPAYATYLGGPGPTDTIEALRVDAAGNAHVAGTTDSATGFPVTGGALQTTFGGGTFDGFVAQVSPTGAAFVFATYLGGNVDDLVHALAVDPLGGVYVTGFTTSLIFPVLFPVQPPPRNAALPDAFVVRLNAAGNTMVYGTYLGGTSFDNGTGIEVDAAQNAWVTGLTFSTDFPSVGAFQPGPAGGRDAFLTMVNPMGTAYVSSSYLGGTGHDDATCLVLDGAGGAYVAGGTTSSDLPTGCAAAAAGYVAAQDGFVTRVVAATAAPQVPTALAATARSRNRVELVWADQSVDECRFEVERSEAGGPFVPVGVTAAGETRFVDEGLVSDTPYAYRVRAAHPLGASPYAGPVPVRTRQTVTLRVRRGVLRDRAEAAADEAWARGFLVFNGDSADGDFDTEQESVEVRVGPASNPLAVFVGAADPGWRSKRGRRVWRSPEGEAPEVRLVVHRRKGRFHFRVRGFEFSPAPGNPVLVSFRAGDDAGSEESDWEVRTDRLRR